MKLLVLGSSAGGGFPQWNCNCAQCAGVRAGRPGLLGRTQSSVAVGGPDDWVLVNASPDLLQQIRANPALQPARRLRDSGIAGVLLCDGQIDHTTGLFLLRERSARLPLWCTDAVYEDLTQGNPVLRVLEHFCGVERQRIDPGGVAFEVPGVAGLRVRALALQSKPAPFSPHRESPVPGDNLGFVFENRSNGRRIFYAPGLAEIDEAARRAMDTSDIVMVDGTFFTDDEMVRLGLSTKTGRQIGHLPQSGTGGMLECLARLPAATRKMLIHINNTNPILDEYSAERAACTAAGVEVCHDGQEIEL
jgi:pyrroloquinoline quinone biosynthesis protein B